MRAIRYKSSWQRVILALAAGTLTGASLVALWIFVAGLGVYESSELLDYAVSVVPPGFVIALAAWGVGLIIFGLPVWGICHELGLRSWLVATTVGATVPFFAALLLVGAVRFIPELLSGPPLQKGNAAADLISWTSLLRWQPVLRFSMWISAAGIPVALIIWRVAYRRVEVDSKLPTAAP